MRQFGGVLCVCGLLQVTTVSAGEHKVPLLYGTSDSTSDPLGLRLVRLCREQVVQPMAQQLRQEVQRQYSPRHLERLLAGGDVETRRAAAFGIGLIGDAHSQPAVSRPPWN